MTLDITMASDGNDGVVKRDLRLVFMRYGWSMGKLFGQGGCSSSLGAEFHLHRYSSFCWLVYCRSDPSDLWSRQT